MILEPVYPSEHVDHPDVFDRLADLLHRLDDTLTVPAGYYPRVTAGQHG